MNSPTSSGPARAPKRLAVSIRWWYSDASYPPQERRVLDVRIRGMLEEIERRHGISFQVIHIRGEEDEKRAYDELFLRYHVRLKRNSGASVTRLKSRSRNVYLQGTLLFLEGNEPYCFVATEQAEASLQGILNGGASHLSDWVRANALVAQSESQRSEDLLVQDFLARRVEFGFPGDIQVEVPLRLHAPAEDGFLRAFDCASEKHVDALHERGDASYDIIEVKTRLNWTAFGQALGYATMFAELRGLPMTRVQPVIICRETDDAVMFACEKAGVKVVSIGKVGHVPS